MNEIRVETALGTLVAKPWGDVDYPAIEVSLIRNGREVAHSMRMEVDNVMLHDNEPVLNMMCWDSMDAPFMLQRFTTEKIDKEMEEID